MRRASILAAAVVVLCLAAPPPAQASWVVAGEFTGTVSYTSSLTSPVTTRGATLTATTCRHQGVPTPSKGPLVISLLGPCSLTLTMPYFVSSLLCVPFGITSASGTFSDNIFGGLGTWKITGASVATTAIFGGVQLVVQGPITQNSPPNQTGHFVLTATLIPDPVGACLTNVSQSFALGEFQFYGL